MNETIRVLMDRDGLSEEEAERRVTQISEEINSLISDGATVQEVENYIQEELGLEPDYLFDIIEIKPQAF